MANLNREQAPFPGEFWDAIDGAAVGAARDLLTARRFLDLEGPYGLGLTSVEAGADRVAEPGGEDGADTLVSRALAVPMLRRLCRLSTRRVAAHLNRGEPINLAPVEDAAEAVAQAEERLIYAGRPADGLPGLIHGEGRLRVECGDWTAVDQVLEDVLAAVTRLDEHGFHGPYALALPPARYNHLFRRYAGSDLLQVDHLRTLCQNGVYKAQIEQPVLVDEHVGTLVLGQDLRVGYAGTDGAHHTLFVSESVVLRVDEPEAVCVLAGA
jgi:uncharacterized linocin/CFP29 family protein